MRNIRSVPEVVSSSQGDGGREPERFVDSLVAAKFLSI